MSEAAAVQTGVSRSVRSIWPGVAIAALAAGFILWSYQYSPTSRFVPLIVGYSMLVLALLDIASRTRGALGQYVRPAAGADFANPEMKHTPPVRRELEQAAWVVGCVAAMMIIGILPAVPLYVLASMRLNGRRPWKEAIIAAAAAGLFTYLVFEVFLSYTLYRGVFVDRRGFAIM
ncbi:MAG TPA: tripartite tricarboxylate transporter TctB family protein [Afifellaceae bacterium]|nr:tripartite tricarboxylate transporter TctB family protein [Afifellaceae bacterium]